MIMPLESLINFSEMHTNWLQQLLFEHTSLPYCGHQVEKNNGKVVSMSTQGKSSKKTVGYKLITS